MSVLIIIFAKVILKLHNFRYNTQTRTSTGFNAKYNKRTIRTRTALKIPRFKIKRPKISRILSFDHVCITLLVLLMGWLLAFASINLTVVNPVKKAFSDFSMTDVYYEIQNSSGVKEINSDIVLVDMTELYDRRKIADCMTAINQCQSKVFVVDLIFERPSYDEEENEYLINAVAGLRNAVFSCKLTDYDYEKDKFRKVRRSFFSSDDDGLTWAFSNVISGEGYGCIRKYSQNEHINDHVIFSLPYAAICRYTNTKPQEQAPKQRNIEYSHTDFIVVPHDKVLENRNLIKGKIVILGTINEEADTHITPLGKMPGMKIQAFAMLSSMSHHKVYALNDYMSILLTIVLCYISSMAGAYLTRRHTYYYLYWIKLYYFLVTALLVWVSFLMFTKYNYYVSLLYPLVGLALVETARLQYKWIVMMLSKHTKLKFIKKSIYYVEK